MASEGAPAELRLVGRGLEEWPEVEAPEALRDLDLAGNAIKAIPGEQLARLAGLERLSAARNELAALPPELGRLARLAELDLGENCLTRLPPEIALLTRLETLDLRANALESVPPELGRLASLRRLFLNENRLAALPDELFDLTRLEVLYVQINRLERLPPAVGRLARLRELMVYDNRLQSIPPEVGALPLEQFECYENPLTEMPGPISSLKEGAVDDAVLAHLRAIAEGPPRTEEGGHRQCCRCGAHPDA
eukprot:tig00000405_g455.t1